MHTAHKPSGPAQPDTDRAKSTDLPECRYSAPCRYLARRIMSQRAGVCIPSAAWLLGGLLIRDRRTSRGPTLPPRMPRSLRSRLDGRTMRYDKLNMRSAPETGRGPVAMSRRRRVVAVLLRAIAAKMWDPLEALNNAWFDVWDDSPFSLAQCRHAQDVHLVFRRSPSGY